MNPQAHLVGNKWKVFSQITFEALLDCKNGFPSNLAVNFHLPRLKEREHEI